MPVFVCAHNLFPDPGTLVCHVQLFESPWTIALQPSDCSPPVPVAREPASVPSILQARQLEWVATPFSRNLSDPGIEPRSPALQADSLLSEPAGKPFVDHGVNQSCIQGGWGWGRDGVHVFPFPATPMLAL